jgi:putative solute:sodium symporter small subunit
MNEKAKAYWKQNLRLLSILLIIWFLVSFGFGILWVDQLDAIRLGGFKLGFWFAQQGSQYVFVILIFVYVYKMNKLDRQFEFDEGDDDKTSDSERQSSGEH